MFFSTNLYKMVHQAVARIKLTFIATFIAVVCSVDAIGGETTCSNIDTSEFNSRLAFQSSYTLDQIENTNDYTLTLKYKLLDNEPIKNTVSMLRSASMKLGASLLFHCTSAPDNFRVSSLTNENGQLFLVTQRRFTSFDAPLPQDPDLLLALLERLDTNLSYANAFNHFSKPLID